MTVDGTITTPARYRIAAVVFLAVALSACGSDDRVTTRTAVDEPTASAVLRQAADTTAGVKSLRAELTSDGGDGRYIVDYQAPDRVRTVSHSDFGTSEIVAIGPTTYVSVPGKPGYFGPFPSFDGSGTSVDFMPALKAMQDAREVERHGSTFRFALPADLFDAESVEGEATVTKGTLTAVTLRVTSGGQRLGFRYTFGMLDAAPSVEPPPPDRIVPYDLGLTPCGPDGSPPPASIVCGETGRK